MLLVVMLAAGVTSIGLGGVGDASTGPTSSGPAFLPSLGKPEQVASTVPANGDVNPYGICLLYTSRCV